MGVPFIDFPTLLRQVLFECGDDDGGVIYKDATKTFELGVQMAVAEDARLVMCCTKYVDM